MSSPHDPQAEVDLHRFSAEAARRRLTQEIHACRVRGFEQLVAITGKGYGNRKQEPLLRDQVEQWLRSKEARALGVRSCRRVHRGGALEIRLVGRGSQARDDGDSDDARDDPGDERWG